MSLNHSAPQPAPTPLCFIYKPQLALLALGNLEDQEATEVRTHVDGCKYCQVQLRQYEIVRAAVARHFGSAAPGRQAQTPSSARQRTNIATPPLTLEDIMQASNKPQAPDAPAERPAPPLRQLTTRQRRLTALGAIAAVLVLAVLAASLFGHLAAGRGGPAVKPIPTTTPFPTWPTPPASQIKGNFTEFAVPTRGADPNFIAAGPDGNLWFTEDHANQIGRGTLQGVIKEFSVPTANAGLIAIAPGADGNAWFTESTADKIGRITPQGAITEFAVPTANAQPGYLTAGHDGNLWFTEEAGDKIGRITPQGAITEFAIPSPNALPEGIAAGGDGNVWFIEYNTTKIGRITAQGDVAEYRASDSAGQTFKAEMPSQPVLLAWSEDGLFFEPANTRGLGFMSSDGTYYDDPGTFSPPGQTPVACAPNAETPNIFAAPDGALWYSGGCLFTRVTNTPDGKTPFGTWSAEDWTGPTPLNPGGVVFTFASDGSVWFVGQSTDQIGRLT